MEVLPGRSHCFPLEENVYRVLWVPTSIPLSTTSSLKLPSPLSRDPWEGQLDWEAGGLVSAHTCVLSDTPPVLGSPQFPREAPTQVTWLSELPW